MYAILAQIHDIFLEALKFAIEAKLKKKMLIS